MTDEVAVGADGGVVVRRLRGGAGARFDRFRLRGAELARLRAGLARIGPVPASAPGIDLGRWYYTLRVRSDAPRCFVAGRVPRRARPVVVQLDGLIDTSSQRDPTYRPR
jgi:hypothetical protein